MTIPEDIRVGLGHFQRWLSRIPGWLLSLSIALITYIGALVLVFPKYFSPLSPFHTDLFDYVSKADLSGWDILTSAPRPVAFFAMYVLGHLGVSGLLAAEIPIVIVSILLLRKYLGLAFGSGEGTLWQFTIYTALVFSQQQFYFMYRHDLPFLIEFAFLILALLLWESAKGKTAPIAIAGSVFFAIASAFSKETLYLVGPALLLLTCLRSPNRWRQNIGGAAGLIVIEFLAHLRAGPYSGSLDPSSPYYASYALPGLIARTFGYVSLLATPMNVLVTIAAIALAKNRTIALGFVIIAILAVVPNSVLPNHVFEEYAWSAMPFFVAPVLLEMRTIPQLARQISTVAILLALIIFAPKPTVGSAWMIYQEKITSNVYDGVSSLALLPPDSVILVVPPKDAPFAFWNAPSYVTHRFTNHNRLEILAPKRAHTASPEGIPVTYGGLDDLNLKDVSYVARFDNTGALVSVEPMPKENCALADDAVIAPALQTWVRNCSLDIADSRNAISAAQAFASVGAWDALKQDARMFPSEAEISKIDKTSHKK